MCSVRSISPLNRRINAGIRNSTVTRLMTIPFASTNPKSRPMENRISISTINPTMVVAPLARIEDREFRMACTMASSAGSPFSFIFVKECNRNTE